MNTRLLYTTIVSQRNTASTALIYTNALRLHTLQKDADRNEQTARADLIYANALIVSTFSLPPLNENRRRKENS